MLKIHHLIKLHFPHQQEKIFPKQEPNIVNRLTSQNCYQTNYFIIIQTLKQSAGSMNQIILKRMSPKKVPRTRSSQKDTKIDKILFRGSLARKSKMNEEPNLELSMLRREKYSFKKHPQISERYPQLQKQSSPSGKVATTNGDTKVENENIKLRTDELVANSPQTQLYLKKSFIGLKHRKLYLYQKSKAKESSLQSLNKINITAPLNQIKPQKEIFRQRSYEKPEFKNVFNLIKSQSCKTRPLSNLLNPQVLLESYRKNQAHDANKRLLLRMSREKDKHIYEQALNHLFELAKLNVWQDKVRAEMPNELEVKEIIIPRRGYKEEWIEKVKKYKASARNNRDKCERKDAVVIDHPPNERHPNRTIKLRAKTDSKVVRNSTRNPTELIDRNQFWIDLIEKPFEPWQSDTNSRFFE